MNKIISLVGIFSLTASMSLADISQKQLDIYLDVSGAGVMLENMQTQMSDMVDMQVKASGEDIDPKVAISITEALSSDKNMAKFTKGFKALDLDLYNNIVSFYASKVGKKSSETAKSMDTVTMEQDMIAFAQLQKEKPFTAKKTKLIDNITNASNAVDMQIKMIESMISSVDDALPEEAKMPKEQKNMMMSQMRPMMEQQIMMSMNFTYKDYSEQELEKVLAHMTSKAGKEEVNILMNGLNEYIKSAMSDMMNSLMMELKAEHPEEFKKAA